MPLAAAGTSSKTGEPVDWARAAAASTRGPNGETRAAVESPATPSSRRKSRREGTTRGDPERVFRPAVDASDVARVFRPAIDQYDVRRLFRPAIEQCDVGRVFRPAFREWSMRADILSSLGTR